MIFSSIESYLMLIIKDKKYKDFPDFDILVSIRYLKDMIDWNYHEFLLDYQNSNKIDAFLNLNTNFTIRNTCRTITQIMLCAAFYSNIKKYYIDTLNEGNQYFTSRYKGLQENLLDNIYAKTSNTIEFRNKFAAHTSYSDPRSDSLDLQLDSMATYYSGLFEDVNSIDSFYIGGKSYIPHNKKWKNFSDTNHTLQKKYYLKYEYDFFQNIINDWENIFEDLVIHFYNQCPINSDNHCIKAWDTISSSDDFLCNNA